MTEDPACNAPDVLLHVFWFLLTASVRGQSDGGPDGPLRPRLPGLQGNPVPPGGAAETQDHAARARASGLRPHVL